MAMGTKEKVYTCLVMSTVSSLLFGVGMLFPMDRLEFFVPKDTKDTKVAEMQTHTLLVRFPEGEWTEKEKDELNFCNQLFDLGRKKARKKGNNDNLEFEKERNAFKGWCVNSNDKDQGFQDVNKHFCREDLTDLIWPDFCNGLSWARVLGISLLVASICNCALHAVGCYMLHGYATQTANPLHRMVGISSLAAGTALVTAATIFYGWFVVSNLATVSVTDLHPPEQEAEPGQAQPLLTVTRDVGCGLGYWLVLAGCILQICQLALIPFVRRAGDEADFLTEKAALYGTFESVSAADKPEPAAAADQAEPAAAAAEAEA